jgi:acetylornithine deacetylase/succinyl-diaminopimelate desuccinylase-like protein
LPDSLVPPLSAEHARWVERAWNAVDADALAGLLVNMVSIPSPPGEEADLARFLAAELERAGFAASTQPIRDRQANAVGRLEGSGAGPSLLLYCPIDTAFEGNEKEDVPWLGDDLRPDFVPHGVQQGDWIVGLGAENPKGFAACVIEAGRAIARAGIPLTGSLLVGLGAGGMPTNRPPSMGDGPPIGHGVGCAHMVESGFRGDFAMICKPGYAVAWEEVGISWWRIRVRARPGYTGVRHLVPYRNAIIDAAAVARALEDWFPEFTARFSSGLVAPQGAVGAVAGGWAYKPAFTPAECDLWVDLRLSPRATVEEVEEALNGVLDRLRAKDPELRVEAERVVAIPGTHTDPDNWIVRSAIRGWEAVEGRPHEPIVGTSGATDAEILRGHGVPTARLGMPRPDESPPYPGFSMGQANIRSMLTLVRCLVWIAIDTCSRSRIEVGLDG